jgi:exopolysaccharide production protein ExoZ
MAEYKSLQILRAVAATSVVYFHIGRSPLAPIPSPIAVFGSFGVDIFFVISGFVMAMVVANGHSARSFAIGRLTRIVPLYWILTTCLLLLAAVKPDLLIATTANLPNYLKSLFFIPYFKENGSLTPMLAVGWTLNYEMFFYLCIWISLVLVKRFYIQSTIIFVAVCYCFASIVPQHNAMSSFLQTRNCLNLSLDCSYTKSTREDNVQITQLLCLS